MKHLVNYTYLKLINYKRIDPEYKNLKYKKILEYLKNMNTVKSDIALHNEKKILETGTSNAAYHYLGSAKILAQIGSAFAKALVKME